MCKMRCSQNMCRTNRVLKKMRTMFLGIVDNLCGHCGQPLWALWTVCFEVGCVFFLAHITCQFGMETTCNVDVHSVICTKRLWTIGIFILNVFLTLLPFVFVFFWTKKMLTIQKYIVHDSFDTVVFFIFIFLLSFRCLHCFFTSRG